MKWFKPAFEIMDRLLKSLGLDSSNTLSKASIRLHWESFSMSFPLTHAVFFKVKYCIIF